MSDLDPRIQQALAVVSDAKAALVATAEAIQTECPHTFVLHRDGHHNFSTIRICPACGLEEQADAYASAQCFVRLRTKFVCNTPDILKHRIPHGPDFKRVQYGRYLKPEEQR